MDYALEAASSPIEKSLKPLKILVLTPCPLVIESAEDPHFCETHVREQQSSKENGKDEISRETSVVTIHSRMVHLTKYTINLTSSSIF